MLEDCKETIIIPLIGTSGLKIEVSGLEIMNDDPGKHICLDVFQLAFCTTMVLALINLPYKISENTFCFS